MNETKRTEIIKNILKQYEQSEKGECVEKNDEYFMKAALLLARQAASEGEIPVGCVIARDGQILCGDYNGRETFKDALYHAESAAIKRASAMLGGWRLTRCTLYVTLEPCPMCAGAVWASRVPKVVIGAKDARAGALGSLINLNSYPLNHKPEVVFGVMENECRELMQSFFLNRRREKKESQNNFAVSDSAQSAVALLDERTKKP